MEESSKTPHAEVVVIKCSKIVFEFTVDFITAQVRFKHSLLVNLSILVENCLDVGCQIGTLGSTRKVFPTTSTTFSSSFLKGSTREGGQKNIVKSKIDTKMGQICLQMGVVDG